MHWEKVKWEAFGAWLDLVVAYVGFGVYSVLEKILCCSWEHGCETICYYSALSC